MAYVKAETIADLFGVTKQTVWAWSRSDPEFPVYNLGSAERPLYRFVVEEVEAYKKEGGRHDK